MLNMKEKDSFKPASLYVPLYKRFMAFIIDVLFIYGAAISFSLGLRVVHSRAWIMLFAGFFSWIYLTFFYSKGKGQTISGRIFGIKVMSVDGSELGFWRAWLRSGLISTIISPIGAVLIVAFSLIIFSVLSLNVKPTKQRRQTFWDVATKSCVIKVESGAERE